MVESILAVLHPVQSRVLRPEPAIGTNVGFRKIAAQRGRMSPMSATGRQRVPTTRTSETPRLPLSRPS